MIALTRRVPPSIHRCELTHLARTPIDYARAVREHDAYEAALQALGCRVDRLPDAPDLPDSVFVEDTAVVFDRLAIIARPGAESRRPETASAADVLGAYRPLAFIESPGTLDGGDVLVVGSHVFVGVSGRTNHAGVTQLRALIAPFGFDVTPVRVTGCLHLKSAVTAASERLVVLNRAWVDPAVFAAFDRVEVDPAEPFAGNVLRINDTVLCAAEHPRTRERLESHGIRTMTVPAGELAKAEGGLTCGSLILSDRSERPSIDRA